MQRKINIEGLDKAEILAALYNNAKVLGMGFFGQQALGDKAGKTMTPEEARDEITKCENKSQLYFDYLHGKAMKINLSTNELDPSGYDHYCGQGSTQIIIERIRKSTNKLYHVGEALEELIEQQKSLDEVNEVLKQTPAQVLNNADISLKIFSLPPQTFTLLGRENELVNKDLNQINVDISYSGKISRFPRLATGEKLVCAYNQWGMPGMAKMFECHSVENMQELYDGYSKGGAITIDWYAMTDAKLENTMKFGRL